MKSGIYRIEAPSGGFYIGSAVDVNARWRQHQYEMRKGVHFNRALQRAANKYGIDNLVFTKLIVCRIEDLIMFEQLFIDHLRPRYNACPTAGSQLGRKHTPEAIRKSAESRRGKSYHTPETRAAVRARMMGNKYACGVVKSAETRAKHSAASKNKRHADAFLSKLNDERRNTIVNSYRDGIGIVALARSNRTDHRLIKQILLAAGVILRRNGKKSGAPALTDQHRNEIVERYRSGQSLRALSKHCGMERRAIKRALAGSGLAIRSRSEAAFLRYS